MMVITNKPFIVNSTKGSAKLHTLSGAVCWICGQQPLRWTLTDIRSGVAVGSEDCLDCVDHSLAECWDDGALMVRLSGLLPLD